MTVFDTAWNLMKGSPVPQYARTKDRDFGQMKGSRGSSEQKTRRGSFMNHPGPTQPNEKEVFMTHTSLSPDAQTDEDLHNRLYQIVGRNTREGKAPPVEEIQSQVEPLMDLAMDERMQHHEDNKRAQLTAEKMPAPSPWVPDTEGDL
jgi:hypothetical protein